MESLKAIIDDGGVVFFGGAGVSTESGIPDFRSESGIYSQKYKYPPETMLSHSFFVSHTEEFFDFYRTKILNPNAKPNITHHVLAKLESNGKLSTVVTQNIDGFHQMAGSRNVIELHGSVHRNYCTKCGKNHDMPQDFADVPRCNCGGVIRPDVVLYQEKLDYTTLENAVRYISRAKTLIVGGTSLSVYPAAGLIEYYRGDRLILINKDPTPLDSTANIVINSNIGDVMRIIDSSGK